MKARVIEIVTLAGLMVYGAANAQQIAYAKNDVKKENESIKHSFFKEEVSDFIISTASARLICAEEGRLAAERGTTDEIKEYGELMMRDQILLLGELKRLAVLNALTIPQDTYETVLALKSGREFNKAFIKTMILEHERDIEIFRQAANSADPEVSAFAARYLPLIESHLQKIRDIKR